MLVPPGAPEPSAGPEAEQILAQVERIAASPRFARAERLRRFLRFIVEQRLAGNPDGVKEFAIGTAVFDRDESYDPRLDPIVRVEASRLRTKLREYYDDEGRDDPIRIQLDKGSYAPVMTARPKPAPVVEFPAPAASEPVYRSRPRWQVATALGSFAFVLGWAVWASVALYNERRPEDARPFLPFWGGFLTRGAENHAVFGSPVFFMSPETDYFHRYVHLNDPSNLQQNPLFAEMQRRFGTLVGPRYDYVEAGDAIVLQRLTAFLTRFGADVRALPAHSATWEGIKEGNVLFMGSNRMHPLLARLPAAVHFAFDEDYNVVNKSPGPGEPPLWKARQNQEIYAIISRLPGLSNDRDLLVLTSHSSPGTVAAADFLTRRTSVESLARLMKSQGAPRNFQVVLRVWVDRGAPVKTEYVAHHWLP